MASHPGRRRAAKRPIGIARSLACAALALTSVIGGRAIATADEATEALVERLRGASLVVEGETGRPYTGWDGADRSTIRTYTPLRVVTVLRGHLDAHDIVLRQPGGDVDGSEAGEGAGFDRGDRLVVFLGERDAVDNSYPIPARMEAAFRVTQDATGVDGIDVRLGADASAYSNREKAPGTLLTRISVGRFEELARSLPNGTSRPPAGDIPAHGQRPPDGRAAKAAATHNSTDLSWLRWVAGLCGLVLVGVWWRWRLRKSAPASVDN